VSDVEVRLLASPYDLQPVVVSAGRHEAQRSEVPVAVASLSAADLAATRPVLFSDALNRLPGVLVVDLGNEQHSMSIRQPMSTRSLYAYLEDGIPVRPAGLFNHNALIELNMAGAERVEVVRGPASALHGAGAVGGAVNVVTPAPPLTPTASAAIRGSAFGYARIDASAGNTWGPLGIRVDGYAARQRDGRREHTDYDRYSATLRSDYALGPGTRLNATLATGHLQTDTDGALDSLTFEALGRGGGRTSLQTFTYRRVDASRLTLRLNRVWDAAGRSTVAVFARDNAVGQLPHYRIRRIASDPARAHGEVNRLAFRSVGLDARHEMLVGPFEGRVVAGVTLDRSPGTFEARYLSIARDPSTGVNLEYTDTDSLLADYDVDVTGGAAFARFEASPIQRLRLIAALRYDGIRYAFDNHLPPSAFSGSPDGASTFAALSPHVGATWAFTSDRGLYANAGRGFVPPEVSELYSGVSVPTLRPARFTSYEAGGWATLAGGRVQLEGSAYVMNGTDEIISVRLPDDSQVNQNAGETRHAGVEYAAVASPWPALSLRVGGSNALHEFVRHEEEGVTLDGNAMPGAPGWIANAEVAVTPAFVRGARVALEWQHVGPYWMNSTNTARYEGYDILNLRASYRLAGAEVWLQLLNAADAHYATMASRGRFGDAYNAGGPRTLVAGVRYGLP
jgi:outer membrane receptor protein involved in Fe transport